MARIIDRADIYSKNMSAAGLSMMNIQNATDEEIGHIVRRAIVNGINVFDMCAGGENVFAPVGKAVEHVRDKVVLTAHFGAGFDELGEYEWIREPAKIQRGFRKMLNEMGADHIDIGMLHFVDDEYDWHCLRDGGVLKYMKRLKKEGVLGRLGFSTDKPALAMKLLDSGEFDAVLISMDDCDDGCREALLERCRRENITVLAAGAAINSPGVTTALASIASLEELDEIIKLI